jgi:hypothetical protein
MGRRRNPASFAYEDAGEQSIGSNAAGLEILSFITTPEVAAGKEILAITRGLAPEPEADPAEHMSNLLDGAEWWKSKSGMQAMLTHMENSKDSTFASTWWDKRAEARAWVYDMIVTTCRDSQNLWIRDFDGRSRRLMEVLVAREPDGWQRVIRALLRIAEVEKEKKLRDDVGNWRAYICKLLRDEAPEIYDEFKEKDLKANGMEDEYDDEP